MSIEIIAGLGTILTALISLMGVVIRASKTLVALEEAVKQLKSFMEAQSKKNNGFLKQIVDHERRIAQIEGYFLKSSPPEAPKEQRKKENEQ